MDVRNGSIRFFSLTALCINLSLLSILMHISRARVDPTLARYKASSAVVLTEVGKFIISFCLALREIRLGDERALSEGEVRGSATVLHGLGLGDVDAPLNEKDDDLDSPLSHKNRSSQRHHGVVAPHQRSTSVEIPIGALKHDLGGADHDGDEVAFRHARVPARLPSMVGSPFHWLRRLYEEVFAHEWWKLGLPAGLFTVQANLQYTAVANLSVPEFQVTSQLKILTTALCSVFLLKRTLSGIQWGSLALLAVGVAFVQLQSSGESHSSSAESAIGRPRMNRLLGLTAVLAACTSSGFASTYFELLLKRVKPTTLPNGLVAGESTPDGNALSQPHPAPQRTPTGLWTRNVQLSLFSLVIGLCGFLIDANSEAMATSGIEMVGVFNLASTFLIGFTPLVYVIVVLQIAGGLLAALVMKYADNIAKNFSTSFSLLLSFVLSVYLFDFRLGLNAIVGATLVLISTWLFTSTPADRSRAGAALGAALSPVIGRIEALSTPREVESR